MSYAKKELHEAIAYLEKARQEEEAFTKLLRAFALGEPVEVTFRAAGATATALAPQQRGKALVERLLCKAQDRVAHLEKQELYWCSVVMEDQEVERISGELYMSDLAKRLKNTPPDSPGDISN